MTNFTIVPPPIYDRPNEANDMTIVEIATNYTPPGWKEVFELSKQELEVVSNIVFNLGPYFPLPKNVFKAFDLTPLDLVKVIIIGQDPYPETDSYSQPIAQGLAFSVASHVPVPASLRNIYKELDRSAGMWKKPHFDRVRESLNLPITKRSYPPSGDLSGWAKQGVLLLNSCLTTKPYTRAGHPSKIWTPFLSRVAEAISAKNPKAIYLLLGKEAQQWKKIINPSHIIVETSHPSPLSVRFGFDGSDVFVKINDALIGQHKTPINWSL